MNGSVRDQGNKIMTQRNLVCPEKKKKKLTVWKCGDSPAEHKEENNTKPPVLSLCVRSYLQLGDRQDGSAVKTTNCS